MNRHSKLLAIAITLLFFLGSVVPVGAVSGVQFLETPGVEQNGIHNARVTIQRSFDSTVRERFVQNEVLVKFKGESKFRRVSLRGEGVEQALARIRGEAGVEYVEPNYLAYAQFTPNDPLYSPFQWHLDNPVNGGINVESAWDISTGAGVTVAVVDTGVAYENNGSAYKRAPDFANTLFVAGYDFVNNDTHPNDDEGHGTHVAGTIAQSTNNNLGVAGIAHGASIMPIKVLNSAGSGSYADIADGIRFAADNGADIINMSLGGSSGSQTLQDAVAYAYGKGVIIVAAAGNDGTSNILYPAAYNSYVIAVGATRYDEALAPYSSHGAGLDIVAPGGDLNVDQNGDSYGDGVVQQTFVPSCGGRWWRQTCTYGNFGYYLYQGTSMATPHVAGVAALVISNGNASTPDDVRAALENSADDLGAAGWDSTYGHGLLNAVSALAYNSGSAPPPPPPPDNQTPVANAGLDQSGETGELLNFNGSGSTDDGIIVSYIWDFGDGASATGTSVSHAYSTSGTYTVTLTVTDDGGLADSDTATAVVSDVAPPPPPENDPPVADAGSNQTVETGELVNFDGSGSTDDGIIVSYIWDFGDGASATGTSVSHTYSTAGTYTVTLAVTDGGGLTDSDTATVTVNDPVPPPPPPPGGDIEVFADSFEVSEWNGLWSEDSQNDWFRSSQRATDGSYSAEVDGRATDASLTSIAIDLQGKTNAAISFSWLIERSVDRNEYLAFDISTDGGATWTEQLKLRGNVDTENVWHSPSIEVNGISALQIRFRGLMSKGKEDANVDDVSVVAF